jgi:hypothetical protein
VHINYFDNGSDDLIEDPLRHKHLSTKSTYLVFGESGNKGAQIGHISLQNIGDAPIVLIAHQRKLDNPRSAIFILRVSFNARKGYSHIQQSPNLDNFRVAQS